MCGRVLRHKSFVALMGHISAFHWTSLLILYLGSELLWVCLAFLQSRLTSQSAGDCFCDFMYHFFRGLLAWEAIIM